MRTVFLWGMQSMLQIVSSQKELAQRSGIDQSDISKVERGIANPSFSTLKRLAEAMDMRLELHFIFK